MRKVHEDAVPARGVNQLAGYILNESPFTDKTELREWVETWLDTWCPRPTEKRRAKKAGKR